MINIINPLTHCLQGNVPFLVAFASKLAFLIVFAYITNVLFYNKLLVAISEDVKYCKFPSIAI
jgi:hypothetical protein